MLPTASIGEYLTGEIRIFLENEMRIQAIYLHLDEQKRLHSGRLEEEDCRTGHKEKLVVTTLNGEVLKSGKHTFRF